MLHLAQHGAFFGFGLAMWMPLAGPLPTPAWFSDLAKLGYVIVVRLAGAVLANVLIWSGTVLYPDYAPGEREWEISPLADQGAAGNLMMIETGVVTLALFAWLFFRAANRGRREAGAPGPRRPPRGRRSTRPAPPARSRPGRGRRLRERILGGRREPLT